MDIVVRPHILSNRARRVEEIDYGMTIQEVIDRIPDLDERVRQNNLAVLIDGVIVPRAAWPLRRISMTDGKVEVMAVLSGSGGNNKQILALVATVFLFAFAGGAAAGLVGEGGMLAGSSYLMVKAGIVLVGTLAINAIFKPPVANNGGDNASATYSFGNQSNQAKRFGRLTRVYGRHRYVADVAAVPYTVNVGDDQYLYVVYSFGYGPLALEDFKIGTNPISNYADVDMIVHENFTSPSQLKIYRQDIWQDPYSLELKKDESVTVTTQVATDKAIVDLAWPSGLGEIDSDDGDRENRQSLTKLEYRASGTTDPWLPAQIRSVSRGRTIGNATGTVHYNVDDYVTFQGYNEDVKSPALLAGTKVFSVEWGVDGPPLPGTKVEFGKSSGAFFWGSSPTLLIVESATADTLTTTTGLPSTIAGGGAGVTITYESPVDPGTGMWDITGYYGAGFNASAELIFPEAGQWDIRVTKLDVDESPNDTTVMWKKFVTGLKSLKNTPPINPVVPITVVEVKIRASGQLNGNIEQFSAIATSKLRQWNGTDWVVDKTRNPAWVYLDILTGTANPKPLPDSRINIEKLKQWAARNDTIDPGFAEVLGTCDIVIDRSYTLWELLQSVASTGRAAPAMQDNLYSVIIDDAAREPVQMFTPRNSRNLRSNRTYMKEPHALRVKWVDPVSDWGPGEIIVYNTGYTAETATEFEELQTFGMTRPEQVTRWGRYMLAQGKLRQERFSLETDIENIVCTRGDLVLVAHDVLEVGGEACRVVDLDGVNVFVDAPPTLDPSQPADSMGVRIRRFDGTFTNILNVVAYGNDGEFDYITLEDPALPQLATVGAGDLLVFGPVSSVVGEYVVDYIRPQGDLGATIGLEELAPAVYDAESSGVIPAYSPPGGGRLPAPAVSGLSYQIMEYYVGIRPMAKIKLKWRPNSSVSYLPDSYQIVEIATDGSELALGNQSKLEYETEEMNLLNWAAKTRRFRVRADYGIRGVADWATIDVTLPSTTSMPPPEVDTFSVTNLSAERRRYEWGWNTGQPDDTVGVSIRYAAGTVLLENLDWSTMTDLTPGASFIAQSGIELNKPLGAGTYTFLCRAIDRLGVLSPVGYRAVVNLSIISAATDTTPPPTPSGFTATGGFNEVTFTSDNPVYEMGRGHSYTQVYAAPYSGGALPVFADAEPFCGFTGERGVAGAPPAKTYRFWAKWVSKDGGISVNPAGGVNGIEATTAIDIPATLDALTGQLTEEQLYGELSARIDLIDGPDTLVGSVAARVKSEADIRAAAILAEANARGAAITDEATARQTADESLSQQITTLTASMNTADADLNAAILAEQTARADGDDALAQDITALAASMDTADADLNAAILAEQTARVNADAAEATARTALTAKVTNQANGSIFYENWQGQTGPEVLANWESFSGSGEKVIAGGVAAAAGTTAAFRAGNNAGDDMVWVAHNGLIPFDPDKLYRLEIRVNRTLGAGTFYAGVIGVKADGTTTVSPSGVTGSGQGHYFAATAESPAAGWQTYVGYLKGHGATAGAANDNWDPTAPATAHPDVRYLRPMFIANYSGQTGQTYIGAITVSEGTGDLNAAAIISEQTARATADSAMASDISALTSTVSGHTSAISTEQTTRANADSAMASDITTLQSKVETRRNEVPGLEAGVDGWTFSQAMADQLPFWGATRSINNPTSGVTGVVSSPFFWVQGGERYTITGDSLLFFNSGGSGQCYFDIVWYNSSDVTVGETGQNALTAQHDFSPTNVNRAAHAISAVAPATAVKAKARFVWAGTGISVVGFRQLKVERGDLPATPYSQEASIQVQAQTVDGLEAQYTVKIDNNGYVTGFGLASTAVNDTPVSTFAVRSDKFYIASPSGPGVAAAMPFVVYTTTQTINGVSVPPGVYMRSAFIHNAFITSAMIQNLDASKVNATSLSAITATIGTLRTATTGARLEIKDNVIKVFDSSNVLRVRLGNLSL